MFLWEHLMIFTQPTKSTLFHNNETVSHDMDLLFSLFLRRVVPYDRNKGWTGPREKTYPESTLRFPAQSLPSNAFSKIVSFSQFF